jgi:hypothetical protein
MESNFKIAFKITVAHTYFEQGICNCLQFTPDDSTKKLLARFGFMTKNKVNGLELYSNSTSELQVFLNYIARVTGQGLFTFKIQTSNPNFNSFTELPTDWTGQLVYDSQSTANVHDADSVQLKETRSNDANNTDFGSLIIRFDDVIKYTDGQNLAQFNISYEARATQWQYFVINKSALKLDNPAVVGKSEISFNTPQNVTIENGEQALLFSSGDNMIPLSEVPKYKFDLVNNPILTDSENQKKSTATKTILKGLPAPDPKRFGLISVDSKKQVSSPMYVYV